MQIVLHAGFHKTGTTSVQHMLRDNARPLARQIRAQGRADAEPLCEAARAYSIRPNPLDEALLISEAAQYFASLDSDDPRPVLLSSEDLSGHMPGRHDLRGYRAAPIMARIARALAEVWPDAQLTVVFSTRAHDAWVRSCWSQHVRGTRFTTDWPDYAATYQPLADLPGTVAAVAEALPGHQVTSFDIADCADRPLGPLDPILDLLGVTEKLRARLKPRLRSNPSPPDHVLQKLLILNRSALSNADCAAAKRAVNADWRAGRV